MRQRFWLWLYHLARAHLPPDYYDEVLSAYTSEKIEELRGQLGDYFVCWLTTDTGPPEPTPLTRGMRYALRDIHHRFR